MPAPADPESVPWPLATPQVVPRTTGGAPVPTLVISPKAVSVSDDSVRTSSAVLELCTSTLYLTVAQPASVPTKPLVTFAVLGASSESTSTLLDVFDAVLAGLMSEWPDAVTTFVTFASSPCTAWKVHVALPALGISNVEQPPKLLMLPTVPAAQVPVDGKTWPYAESQIWSIVTPPTFVVLVMVAV